MMYTGFNTTLARFFVPATKEEILKKGGYREEGNEIQIIEEGSHLPGSIITCTKTGKKFDFAQQYIDFCQKYQIALPSVTHLERIKENFIFCSSITPIKAASAISGKPLIHYYHPDLGFQKIITKEEYDKLIY